MPNTTTNTNIEWIDSQELLADFCSHAGQQAWVTFDTEFMRETTFFAKLALIQMATTERVACIDPLAIVDLTPLETILFEPGILKIVHAGSQDLEIFHDRYQKIIQPLFDTQIAASLLGYGEQIGYGPLVEKICGVVLGKGHQRADWMHRPLDHKTMTYAANDVTYLRDVYRKLNQEMQDLDRQAWLDEEQKTMLDSSSYQIDLTTAWHRIKGKQKLRGVGCVIAQQIAAWRELRAQKQNRPRRRILSDDQVLDLAMRQPRSLQELKTLRSMDKRMPEGLLRELLALVQKAVAMPADQWPEAFDRHKKRSYDNATLLALQAVLEYQADRHKISPQQLASLAELQRIAAGDLDVAVFRGWRKKLAGDALLDFVNGDTAIRIESRKLLLNNTK